MDRHTELALLDQVLGQIARGVPDMAPSGGTAPVAHYLDAKRYEEECASVFRDFPIALAHCDQIAKPGDYLLREVAGKFIIVIRGADGRARAFLNACRHRGAQLLSEPKGHVRALVCPYHAWTYRPDGTLFGRPGAEGFCDVDPSTLGLLAFSCTERLGIVWVCPRPEQPAGEPDWDAWFAPIDQELADLNIDSHVVFSVRDVEVAANWKAVNDAFMEGYHFRFVHKDSVAPHYCDNQGVFTPMGPHYRYLLARREMPEQAQLPREERQLRPH